MNMQPIRSKREPAAWSGNHVEPSCEPLDQLIGFITAARQNVIEEPIRDLVAVRAAQMTGYASCLDMHVKQARAHGEHELRLHHLVAWRDSILFGPRERAALAWTEVLTEQPDEKVPREIYDSVRTQLSDREISDLSLVVIAVNCWNRLHAGLGSLSDPADAFVPALVRQRDRIGRA